MKLPHSLQFKIAASLFLVGAVLITVSAVRSYERAVGDRNRALRETAFGEGSRLSGMIQHFSRRRASRAADLELSYVSTNPDVKLGLICDSSDIVRHATRQQLRGLPFSETPMAHYADRVARARESMEPSVEKLADGRSLIAIFIYWEGLARGSKGFVILEYDLNRPLAVAARGALWASLAQALGLAGGSLALWLVLKLVVTQRVEALVGQVESMSLETDPAPMMAGNDELARVSRVIDATHQRLRQSEQRFRQIAATMRDVFWIAPAAPEESAYVNGAYESLFERQAAALQKRHWDWLRALMPENRRGCLAMLQSLRKEGGRDEVAARIVTPSGQMRWINCRGFALASDAGAPYSVAGIVIDVTDSKMLQRRLLDTAENERRRIGMDLHDDLCQRLAAAQLKAGVLQSALARDASGRQAISAELVAELSETIALARNFARGLAPVGIEALGLPVALADFGEFITRAFGVPCRVECPASIAPISGEAATHIFRIAQELTTNVVKHSHPQWVELSFETRGDEARLQVIHDGASFRPTAASKTGMGLHLVQQRLDALGASLFYHDARSGFAVAGVTCLIPLHAHQHVQPLAPEGEGVQAYDTGTTHAE